MLKLQAINLFGGTPSGAATALGISYQAVTKWPDVLPNRIADRVLGACVRNGVLIPPEFTSAAQPVAANPAEPAGGDWGTAFDAPALTAGLVPQGQGSRPAAELTTDPALNADLTRAEQAGLVKLPHPAPAWDGVERRAQAPRRAAGRERDICQAGKGAV